jgi:chorismate mutase-like protein
VASLIDLRNEIDEIDKKLHDLLMRRIEIGREVAEAKRGADSGPNLRPGREAQIIRGLAGRNNGSLSMDSVVRIWREILSANLNQQIEIRAVTLSSDVDFQGLAAEYVGTASKLSYLNDIEGVIESVAKGEAEIGVLPDLTTGVHGRWWPKLANIYESRKINIISYLPIITRRSKQPGAFIIAAQKPERSGNDTSIFIVDGDTYGVPGRIMDEYGNKKLVFVDGYQQSLGAVADSKWEQIGAFPNPISQ